MMKGSKKIQKIGPTKRFKKARKLHWLPLELDSEVRVFLLFKVKNRTDRASNIL
jgi:hypothetical protein